MVNRVMQLHSRAKDADAQPWLPLIGQLRHAADGAIWPSSAAVIGPYRFGFLESPLSGEILTDRLRSPVVGGITPLLKRVRSMASSGMCSVLLDEDFESNRLPTGAACSGNCPVIMNDGGQEGRFLRAMLSNQDSVSYRTEVSFGDLSRLSVEGPFYLIYFRMRTHEDTGDFPSAIFMQLHTRTKKEKEGMDVWLPLVGRLKPGSETGLWQTYLEGQTTRRGLFDVQYGEWKECLLVVRLSATDGQITAYGPEAQEFGHFGKNASSHWKHPLFLKLGVYAARVRTKSGTFVGRIQRVTDFDNIIIADLSAICPSGIPCDISDYLYTDR